MNISAKINTMQNINIFTAMHGMQMRSSDEKAVCPSVSLSIKRVDYDKTEEDLSRYVNYTKYHLA